MMYPAASAWCNKLLTKTQVLWAFSIWLECVAILPQLFMLQRTGEAETITTHYLFALGIYRALYILNWIYRYYSEGVFDPRAVIAGVIQTVLYSDFFWIYYTKSVIPQPFVFFGAIKMVIAKYDRRNPKSSALLSHC